MPPLTHAAALEFLRPHLTRLSVVVREGWNKYVEIRDTSPFLDKTARAAFVHDAMVFVARQQFDGVAGVSIIPYEQSWMVAIDGVLFIRLKKFNPALRPDNILTDLQLDMLGQMTIAGYGPSPTYLVAGYTLNILETAIEGVHIVCPLEKVNKWTMTIGDDGSIAEVVEMRNIFDEEPSPVTFTPKLLPFPKVDENETGRADNDSDHTDDDETDPKS